MIVQLVTKKCYADNDEIYLFIPKQGASDLFGGTFLKGERPLFFLLFSFLNILNLFTLFIFASVCILIVMVDAAFSY